MIILVFFTRQKQIFVIRMGQSHLSTISSRTMLHCFSDVNYLRIGNSFWPWEDNNNFLAFIPTNFRCFWLVGAKIWSVGDNFTWRRCYLINVDEKVDMNQEMLKSNWVASSFLDFLSTRARIPVLEQIKSGPGICEFDVWKLVFSLENRRKFTIRCNLSSILWWCKRYVSILVPK